MAAGIYNKQHIVIMSTLSSLLSRIIQCFGSIIQTCYLFIPFFWASDKTSKCLTPTCLSQSKYRMSLTTAAHAVMVNINIRNSLPRAYCESPPVQIYLLPNNIGHPLGKDGLGSLINFFPVNHKPVHTV